MSDTPVNPSVQDAAVKLMTTWVASIADRLKNPIAGIAAALDVVEASLSVEPGRSSMVAALTMMRGRVMTMNGYVSELVNFAKPAELQSAPLDLKALLQRVLQGAQLELPAEARVRHELGAGTFTIFGDAAKLRLALMALIENAAQAVSPDCVPMIHVSLEHVELASQPAFRVAIEDNGSGISADLEEQIFAPFFSTREAGTGLGLAIVRKYVEAHGGRVSVRPALMLGGARFEVDLPRAKA